MARVTVLDAPSNLGLRPLWPGHVPGTNGAPATLRSLGLLDGLDLVDAGAVSAPPYDASWSPGEGDRNGAALARYSRELADRLGPLLGESFVLVLGGDCSVLIGEALALRRRGRYGLVFIDAHGDFRHPGNGEIVAAAGEDLAIVTGRGDARLVDLEGLGPSIRDDDVVAIGLRPHDDSLDELRSLGIPVTTSDRIVGASVDPAVEVAIGRVSRAGLDGYWVHVDVDVIDAAAMPAVDSPEPGGLTFEALGRLLQGLCTHERAVGLDLCIYDPDKDPGRVYGRSLVAMLRGLIAALG